jgi:DNA-binding response OmpR family regulator
VIDTCFASSTRVLLIEHEARLRESIAAGLALNRYTYEVVADGLSALKQAAVKAFDLVLVDLAAPDVQRLHVSRLFRQHTLNRHVPIVIIAPNDGLAAALAEIEHGADDFLTKPFGPHELAARARAAIHRSRATSNGARTGLHSSVRTAAAPPVVHRDIRVDPARRHVSVGDRTVQLTEHEFHLLYVLAGHPGVVFSRDGLLARIWGRGRSVTGRSVDTLVSRLRRRIEPGESDAPQYIRTVRGVGYKLGEV